MVLGNCLPCAVKRGVRARRVQSTALLLSNWREFQGKVTWRHTRSSSPRGKVYREKCRPHPFLKTLDFGIGNRSGETDTTLKTLDFEIGIERGSHPTLKDFDSPRFWTLESVWRETEREPPHQGFGLSKTSCIFSSMANLSLPNLLFTLFLLLLPVHALTQTSTNVSLGDSLSTDGSSNWVSPSGDFAFGFRRVGSQDLFLLAIWFDKIPEKTIVWSANPDNPVWGGSKVELTTDGRLVLADPQGQEIWKKEATNGTVTSAALLNTGNFVLLGEASATKWQSFAEPTNTILPTQELPLGTELVAPESESNYTRGRFKLIMQLDGNLVLYPLATISDIRYNAYWATDTVGNGSKLVFNKSGYIYLPLKSGNLRYLTTENVIPMPTTSYYQRATLDYDGVFRQYYHPRSPESDGSGSQNWTITQFVPDDICSAIRADNGGGACGFNGYCRLDDSRQPTCNCPPQYISLDPNHTYKGCMPNFTPQICGTDESSRAGPQFRLSRVDNVDWPLADYEHYNLVSEDQCQEACLSDCFCAVAIYSASEGDCWKKKLPLSNGRMNPNVGRRAFIKVPRSNSAQSSPPGVIPTGTGRGKKDQSTLVVILSSLLGSSAFLNFFLLSLVILMIFFSSRKKSDQLQPHPSMIGVNLRRFTYQELEKVTDQFKEELGRGSCGVVYKGMIASENVNLVAVKRLEKVANEADKEFKTEVSAIGQIHHKNLVRLIGFCDEGEERLLVYEYMSNGSLASFLFGDLRLSWHQRTQIAYGIARGLVYLHEECGRQIIHCDIKPQNILLDDSFTARISDFGLAKLLMGNQTRTKTDIRGTRGYVATEWFKSVPITTKVDVYSFGVMLLEIICCRRNVLPELEEGDDTILTDWVCDCYREGRIDRLVENDEAASKDVAKVERMVMVAIWCIQEDPHLRPSMRKVTQMLEGAVEVAVPPDPCSFISSLA
ncbi:hypothetical protein ACLOJK_017423 [Asimina triloba]